MYTLSNLTIPHGKIAIHWFEQNSFAIKGKSGKIILIDPFFPESRPSEVYVYQTSPVNPKDLQVDFVLFTHDHLDHTHVETVKNIFATSKFAKFAGPPESINRITSKANIPAENCITITPNSKIEYLDVKIYSFYSKPPDGDKKANIPPPDTTHLGYVIKIDEKTLYFTGDCIRTLADHDEILTAIKKLKPQIGFVVTHPTEGEFPFFEDTVKLAEKLNLETIVPAHYSCFAKRNYDPLKFAEFFRNHKTKALIIPYNSHVLI
ncbi:MAG TPA: MBL fold metallo-hydrolase [Victivallales bacterium]|nr:MBL fold metallo-hydrolase [Victivallales bacterium]HPO89928.1 MBL fold metallo-hydrolase [Victivallales bacterium]